MVVNKEPIRSFNGRILGWVETDEKGNQTVSSFNGVVLGKYDKVNDCTRDFSGRVITKGNTAVGLIYKNAQL